MTSPFYIATDFLSAKFCEELVERFGVRTPNTNPDGKPIKLERIIKSNEGQEIILNKLYSHIGNIERQFDCVYRGIEPVSIIHYPENDKTHAEAPYCENAKFFRKKWIKSKDVDLTGVIWLKEYNETAPLDPRFEICGSKLEFPAYNFSLTPQRGTMVLYPAGPHFVNSISPVVIGDAYQIKINISITAQNGGLWIYDPKNFAVGNEGFLLGWFKEFI
jgi:hypothetical protein